MAMYYQIVESRDSIELAGAYAGEGLAIQLLHLEVHQKLIR